MSRRSTPARGPGHARDGRDGRSVAPVATLHLPGSDAGALRSDLDVPLGARCTTLVGPNAAGKSNVLEAIAAALDGLVLHLPAGADPAAVATEVVATLADRQPASDGSDGAVGRAGDHERSLRELFLEEAQHVVPEVAEVEVDLADGVLVARDRHGMAFSASAGLRAPLALALARVVGEQGRTLAAVLLEEPGAFLHPAAQEVLRERIIEVAGTVPSRWVLTSESPFVIPRGPDDLVVALARGERGGPGIVRWAPGDDPQAGTIGGLYRDPGLGAVLDRAARLVPGTRAIVVFEGGTDEAYLRLAAEALGRADELDGIAIVPAGGASAAALEAVVLRAQTDLPLLVVLDNDEPGQTARHTLTNRLGFEKRREATTYAEVVPGYPPGTEAEDLFDDGFVARFVEDFGPDAITGKRILWGQGSAQETWHHDLTSASKSAFVRWARKHATPDDVQGWASLLDVLAERLDVAGRDNPA